MNENTVLAGIIGMCTGIVICAILTLPQMIDMHNQLTAHENVREFNTMCFAHRTMHGDPLKTMKLGDIEFMTDANGAVLAKYTDGWRAIGEVC
jgi:hypothetical protein